MAYIKIRGTEDFARAAGKLRDAPQEIRREAFRALSSGTKGVRNEIKADLAGYVPDGYAAELAADLSVTNNTRLSGGSPSVRIRAKGRKRTRMVGPLDRGLLRHPLFGDFGRWYRQRVKDGFFTKTVRDRADEVRDALIDALERVVNKIS